MNHQQSRDIAIMWSRAMLEKSFVVLDTETTGLDGEAEALAIAVIDRFGNTLLDARCKPTHRIWSYEKAERVHGISWEQSQEFPPFTAVRDYLEYIFGAFSYDIISYCVDQFDAKILYQTCYNNNPHQEPLDIKDRAIDLLPVFSKFYGDWSDYYQSYKWYNLSFAARFFGLDTGGAHGALADCQMALGVLRGMAAAKLSSEGDEAEK